MAWQDYLDTVQEAYIAYYQRPADPVGLVYWAQRLDLAKGDLSQIIDAFANSEEAKALYGDINENTIGNVIDQIYQAAFNRAPDDAGKQFYINGFKEGKFTPATIMLDILNGAQNDDLITLQNKVTSAMNFTKAIDPELDGRDLLATYEGDDDAQAARDFLKDVGATVNTVKTQSDATNFIREKIADPGDTILNVTSGGYEFTINTDALTGTDSDDAFSAAVTVNSIGNSVDALQSQDVADGGDGNDTLTATVLGGRYSPKLSNIETLDVRALNNATFDFANFSGVEKFINDGSIGNVTLRNIPSMIELAIKDVKGNATTIDYLNSVLTGSSDTQKITLDNTTENHNINLGAVAPEGIEELDIDAVNNKSVVQINNALNVKTVKVSGDAALQMSFGDADSATVGVQGIANLKTFDAAENKGGITANLATNVAASNITVTGSSGDDKITLTNVDDKDSVDLGEGNDDLIIAGHNTDVNKAVTLKNVENIYFANLGANNKIFNMSGADSVKTIGVIDDGAVQEDVKVTKVGDTFEKIVLNAYGKTAAGAIDGIDVSATNALTNTDDSVDVFVTNKDANGNLIDPGAGNQFNVNVKVPNFENVNISTESLGANVYNTDGTIKTAGGVKFAFTDASLVNLKVDSDYYVDLTGVGGNINTATSIRSVDASNATAGVNINVSAAADSTSTGAKTVTITTGSGNDNVTFGAAVNTKVTSGDGHDTLTLAAASNIAGNLTINAGSGNDKIDISADTTPVGDTANVVRIITGDGVDTVKVNDNGSENIQLLDFTPGSSGDVIDLAANNAAEGTAGGTTDIDPVKFKAHNASGVAFAADAGLIVLTGATFANATAAEAKITTDDANDALYFIYTDGSDSYLCFGKDANGDGDFADTTGATPDTLTTVVTFVGVSDPSQFDAHNFADFLA